MRKTIAVMTGLALLAACGCQKGVRGGGEAKDTKFRIDVPNMTQEIRQGEVKTITIKMDRGSYFKQDVRLTIHEPEGLTVDPTNLVVRASDPPNVPVRISVPQNAAVGNYEVRVTGEPQEGAPASARFTVKVVAPKGAAAASTAPAY